LSHSRLLLMILSLCLVLVLVYLMAGYFKEQGSKRALITQIDTATRTLLVLPDPAPNLSERLEQAKADNLAAKHGAYGNGPDTTEIIVLLLKTADDCHLQVDPISSEQWSKKSIGSGTYRMLPIELVLSGNQEDFYLFIAELENRQLFPTLAIEEMSVTRSSPLGLDAEASFSVKLTLSLAVRLDVTG
jgi:hypothetical protein